MVEGARSGYDQEGMVSEEISGWLRTLPAHETPSSLSTSLNTRLTMTPHQMRILTDLLARMGDDVRVIRGLVAKLVPERPEA